MFPPWACFAINPENAPRLEASVCRREPHRELTPAIFPRTLRAMSDDNTFESFKTELNRLVESFGKRLAELKQPGYAEAQLRDDFLNPFFRALGWDMENRAGLIQKEREV